LYDLPTHPDTTDETKNKVFKSTPQEEASSTNMSAKLDHMRSLLQESKEELAECRMMLMSYARRVALLEEEKITLTLQLEALSRSSGLEKQEEIVLDV
ncbi:hypothetical protein L195_g013976, partial [Trifolium pratense]